MSKTIRRSDTECLRAPRNSEAYAMIVSGKGKKQIFADRRNKRPKDAKRSWRRDLQDNG